MTLVAGCGRLGFDASAKGDGPAAGPGVVDPSELVDLTAAAPLLTAPLQTTSDCGKYLVALRGFGLGGQMWHPTVVGIGDSAYLVVPCKYGDPGDWSLGLARYDAGASVAVWIDGNAAAPGVNEMITPNDPAVTSQRIGSLGNLALASDGTQLFGLGATFYTGAPTTMPVHIASGKPEDLRADAYDPAHIGSFDLAAGDGTWRGGTALEHAPVFRDGAFQVFTMHTDAPSSMMSYIAVHTALPTLDGATFATAPLLTGYSHPIVATSADRVYLFAIDDFNLRYVLFQAPSIAELASAPPQPLDLARFRGLTANAWNAGLFAFVGDEPRVVGAWVHGQDLFVFYLAGSGEFTPAAAPYNSARSIGLLRMPVH
jgi:hypothetical protein